MKWQKKAIIFIVVIILFWAISQVWTTTVANEEVPLKAGDYIYYRVDDPASFIKISIEADKPVDIYVLDEENFKLFQNNQLSQVRYYAGPSRENVYSLDIKWHVPKSGTYYIIIHSRSMLTTTKVKVHIEKNIISL